MGKIFLALATCLSLFASVAIAAEETTEGQGLSLDAGAQLIALGVAASLVLLAVLYFILSKRSKG